MIRFQKCHLETRRIVVEIDEVFEQILMRRLRLVQWTTCFLLVTLVLGGYQTWSGDRIASFSWLVAIWTMVFFGIWSHYFSVRRKIREGLYGSEEHEARALRWRIRAAAQKADRE
jgi:hypothetical protein